MNFSQNPGMGKAPSNKRRYFVCESAGVRNKVPTSTGAQSMCLPSGEHGSMTVAGNCSKGGEMGSEMATRALVNHKLKVQSSGGSRSRSS